MLNTCLFEQIEDVVVVGRRKRSEVSLLIVLLNERKQVGELARLREEVLALAVLYVFLQVERYLFGHAEILHVGRDVDTEFLAESKEMVDSMARCKDDGCMTTYRNVL